MFGKKSKLSETQKFVIAMGQKAGNLKKAGPAFNKKKPLPTNGGGEVGKKQGKPPFERESGPKRNLGRAGKFAP